MKSSAMIRHGHLLLGLYFCSIVLPGTLLAGKVKVATNVGNTYYFGEQNTFANVLLNCTGFNGTPGVDLTADGVSMRPGQGAWFSYHPKLTPGMWPDSTDDRTTWYKFSYHCDADASKNFPAFAGFTVAQPAESDGKGNWTGWLKFKASNLKDDRIAVTVNYAKEDLDEKGLARHPISQLKVLLPGCTDDDFLSPIFKKRMGGFARLRFCDPFNMNGRPVGFGFDVPGTKNTYEREGKGNFRAIVTPPGNVQTETYFKGMDLNMSWGKGPGAGNHMSIWNGKKYDEAILGIGCLAPCELEYDLKGRFYLFYASVGIDHEVDGGGVEPHGNVTFQVWAASTPKPGPQDYQLLHEIKNLTSRTPLTRVFLDVTGKTGLKLKMLDNGDPNGHVDIVQPGAYFIQKWTDRNLPTNCCRSMSGFNSPKLLEMAFPYEYALRMCNDLNADIWVNLPCTADDDYLCNFADLMLYGSDPVGKVYTAAGGANPRPADPPPGWHPPLKKNLNFWIENDNEVWNWGYACFQYYYKKGEFNHRTTYQQYAVDLKHISDILKPRFAAAGRAASLKIVFSNQIRGGWGDHNTDETFEYMERNFGPVNGYVDYYAEAPYCGTVNHWKDVKTLDDVFANQQDEFETTIQHVMPEMGRRAARWKLGVTTYEGGFHWEGAPKELFWMIQAGRLNPRTGMIYDQYLQSWQASCGKDAIYQEYSMFSNYEGDAWPFLAIQYCGEGLKGTPSYDGLIRNSHPAGDCDLDGKVTYADFKILAENFSLGGDGEKDRRWWSQGDFNNDQVVGLDDLKLLLLNCDLRNWTAAQQQEVQAFLDAHPGPYVVGPDPGTRQGTWTLRTWRNHEKIISIPAQEDSGGVPSSYVLLTEPRHGKVDVSAYPSVRYAPNKDYLGIDDFVVAVKDDKNFQSNPVWVAVEVGTSTDPDVIANCHCDENSGVTMTDTGGNAGTLNNTVSWTEGKSKSGLAFSWAPGDKLPVPGFVKLENAPALAGSAYTLSLWVRPDEVPTAKSTGAAMGELKVVAGLLTKASEVHFAGLCFVPDAQDPGKGHFTMGHLVWFSAAPLTAASPEAYAPGQWHHVVGVVDPMAQDLAEGQSPKSSGVVRLYVDGKLVKKVRQDGKPLGSFFKFGKDGGNFYLGACHPGDVPKRDDQFKCRGCFKGAIDEVRIYKRALSDAEVAALYQGVASMPPTVAISKPAANASFSAGADITLQASANDVDGDVARVDYYLGEVAANKKLNTAGIVAAPFTFVWKGVKPGTYTIIAVATDDTGVTAKSSPVALTVK